MTELPSKAADQDTLPFDYDDTPAPDSGYFSEAYYVQKQLIEAAVEEVVRAGYKSDRIRIRNGEHVMRVAQSLGGLLIRGELPPDEHDILWKFFQAEKVKIDKSISPDLEPANLTAATILRDTHIPGSALDNAENDYDFRERASGEASRSPHQ